MDQGSSFTLKAVREFCNTEGIEIVYSPVNDHRAIGRVERTIGSINNLVLIYVKEESHRNLETKVERARGALPFAPDARVKMSTFEAHGREADTALRNLTKSLRFIT